MIKKGQDPTKVILENTFTDTMTKPELLLTHSTPMTNYNHMLKYRGMTTHLANQIQIAEGDQSLR